MCKYTYDDLGNDFGLTEGFEEESEGAANDEDQGGLNDEEWEGVVQRIVALPHAIRRRFDGGYVHRHRCAPYIKL